MTNLFMVRDVTAFFILTKPIWFLCAGPRRAGGRAPRSAAPLPAAPSPPPFRPRTTRPRAAHGPAGRCAHGWRWRAGGAAGPECGVYVVAGRSAPLHAPRLRRLMTVGHLNIDRIHMSYKI